MTDKDYSKAAKEYFAQIRKTDRLIQRLTNTVATLRSSLTSQNYALNPNKVQSSRKTDQMSETVAKIADFETEINTRIDELIDLKRDAFTRINKVPDLDQQNVLVGRYIQMKEWDDIAIEFNFSTQWMFEIHGRGLLSFAEENREFLDTRVKASCTG